MSSNRNAYFRFLNLLRGVEASFFPPTLDATAKTLLELIASQHAIGSPMTVTEAMGMQQVASPATIHRKIDDLRLAGLVNTEFQDDNRRTKYLVPTPKARKFFDKLSTLLPQASALR
jgi:DNA-binding MarR family transcriptional regulator